MKYKVKGTKARILLFIGPFSPLLFSFPRTPVEGVNRIVLQSKREAGFPVPRSIRVNGANERKRFKR